LQKLALVISKIYKQSAKSGRSRAIHEVHLFQYFSDAKRHCCKDMDGWLWNSCLSFRMNACRCPQHFDQQDYSQQNQFLLS